MFNNNRNNNGNGRKAIDSNLLLVIFMVVILGAILLIRGSSGIDASNAPSIDLQTFFHSPVCIGTLFTIGIMAAVVSFALGNKG